MNKKNYILNQCKGKSVLDLGCIQDVSMIDSPEWLHGQIKKVAKSLVGVDVDEVKIEGYDIIRLNVENMKGFMSLSHFDTIVAGDLIEHLLNAGLFLDSIKSLNFDKLIITTPNVMSPKYWTLGKEKIHPQHTCWYSMTTLIQLVKMKGFKVVNQTYGYNTKPHGIVSVLKILMYKVLPQTGNKLLITITK